MDRCVQGRDDLRIEYFILTKRKINYQAYQTVMENAIKEDSRFAIVHLWNEAHEVAKNAVGKMMANGFIKELCDKGKSGVYVWTIGFGGTGEAITNELFVQTPGVSDGCSRPFAVNVFDKKMSDAGEIFRADHAGYKFLQDPTWAGLIESAKAESVAKKGLPAPVFGFHELNAMPQEPSESGDGVCAMIGTAQEKRKTELYTMKPDILGRDGTAPDVIVISTGDDYRNITYANVISQWIVDDKALRLKQKKAEEEAKKAEEERIRAEALAAGKEVAEAVATWEDTGEAEQGEADEEECKNDLRFILVSIFDEDNNHLLSSYGEKREESSRVITVSDENGAFLKIVIVNNLEDVYSFEGYKRNARAAVLKNMTYNQLSGGGEKLFIPLKALSNLKKVDADYTAIGYDFEKVLGSVTEEYREELKTRLAKGCDEKEKIVVERINSLLLESRKIARASAEERHEVAKDPTIDFNALTLWKRESNRYVVDAEPFYQAYFRKKAKELVAKHKDPSEISAEEMFAWKEHAAAIEHDRWTRLHLSDGWINAERADQRRHHPCILSYRDLQADPELSETIVYDVMNVLWAMSDDELFKG